MHLRNALLWAKSCIFPHVKCQICDNKVKYKDTGVIKVRYGNGNGKVMDMIICDSCIQTLEKTKVKK